MTDTGNPTNEPERAVRANALIFVIESHYQHIIHTMRTLDEVIAPFTTHWPRTKRERSTRLPQTDYHWFCDYLGEAVTPLGFAIVGGKRGGDVAALLHEIRSRLSAGRDEFGKMEQRIATELQQGRMNAMQVERLLTIFKDIMASTLTLMGHIEHYRSIEPAGEQ